MRVLIIGNGGREQALQVALNKSKKVSGVEITPWTTISKAVSEAKKKKGQLVIIGPEAPLAVGLTDALEKEGIKVFGPNKLAAELEASKVYMKTRCERWGIRTARFDFARNMKMVEKIIARHHFHVIKADGVCGGKGAYVEDTDDAVLAIAEDLLVKKIHGDAGDWVVLEEKLVGVECSVKGITDGDDLVMLPTAKDHKRAYDGDKGPNTGGMGAVAPSPDVDQAMLERIRTEIFMPTIRGMKRESRPIKGVLFAGVMIVPERGDRVPYLLEWGVRFADPETQVVLPLIESDIFEYMLAALTQGELAKLPPLHMNPLKAVGVVQVPKNYPGDGTSRIRTVVEVGSTYAEARELAYAQMRQMDPKGESRYRSDIGAGL